MAEFRPKSCRACGNEFTPTGSRQVYCGNCRRPDQGGPRPDPDRESGRQSRTARMEPEVWQRIEPHHREVAARIQAHNVPVTTGLMQRRTTAVVEALRAGDDKALRGALIDLAALATEWAAYPKPTTVGAGNDLPTKIRRLDKPAEVVAEPIEAKPETNGLVAAYHDLLLERAREELADESALERIESLVRSAP